MEINTVYISLKDYQELILENADLKGQNEKLEKEYERIEKRIFNDILKNEDFTISQIKEFSYDDYYYRKLFDILKENGYLFDYKINDIIVCLKYECDKKRKKND